MVGPFGRRQPYIYHLHLHLHLHLPLTTWTAGLRAKRDSKQRLLYTLADRDHVLCPCPCPLAPIPVPVPPGAAHPPLGRQSTSFPLQTAQQTQVYDYTLHTSSLDPRSGPSPGYRAGEEGAKRPYRRRCRHRHDAVENHGVGRRSACSARTLASVIISGINSATIYDTRTTLKTKTKDMPFNEGLA